jgi:hypothetical protein
VKYTCGDENKENRPSFGQNQSRFVRHPEEMGISRKIDIVLDKGLVLTFSDIKNTSLTSSCFLYGNVKDQTFSFFLDNKISLPINSIIKGI